MSNALMTMRQLESLVRRAKAKRHEIISSPPLVRHYLTVGDREYVVVSDGSKAAVTYVGPVVAVDAQSGFSCASV